MGRGITWLLITIILQRHMRKELLQPKVWSLGRAEEIFFFSHPMGPPGQEQEAGPIVTSLTVGMKNKAEEVPEEHPGGARERTRTMEPVPGTALQGVPVAELGVVAVSGATRIEMPKKPQEVAGVEEVVVKCPMVSRMNSRREMEMTSTTTTTASSIDKRRKEEEEEEEEEEGGGQRK